MWLEEQIRLINEIDAAWSKINHAYLSKIKNSTKNERLYLCSWFCHLNCIYDELKRQQNWEQSNKLKKIIMDLFGKYLESTVKTDFPCFSPIWVENNKSWPLSPNLVYYNTLYRFGMYSTGNDMWGVIATGHYKQELNETVLFLRIMPHVELVVDVGANIGFYSLLAAKASNKNVLAFEPTSKNYNTLLCSVNKNKLGKKIKALRFGVGAYEGKADINICALGSGGNTLLSQTHVPMTKDTETISLTTLDIIQKKYAKKYPDTLIKIDVEGFENEVLQGGLNWLLHKNAPVILIESWPKRGKSNSNHIEVVKKLQALKYKVYPILRPANNKSPLGKECSLFNYKSPIGNYIALPPNKKNLIFELKKPTDNRIFTRREHLEAILNFLQNSLSYIQSGA